MGIINTFNFKLFAGLIKFELKNPNFSGKTMIMLSIIAFITGWIAYCGFSFLFLFGINHLFNTSISYTIENIFITAILIAIVRE